MPQRKTQDPRINWERVRLIFEQSTFTTTGTVSAALILGITLYNISPLPNIVVWVLAAVSITIARQLLIVQLRRKQVPPEGMDRWKTYFIFLLLISGMIWGSLGIFLFPRNDIAYQIIVLFFLVAMVAGAVSIFYPVLTAFIAYSVPAVLPVAINFLTIKDQFHYALGILTIVYLLFMILYAFNMNRQTGNVLALKFENIDLVRYLESAKAHADAANINLKMEITEREKAEEALRSHKKNLEDLVRERTVELQKTNLELRKEIEERIRTASALKVSEEKYRLLVENANDAICILQQGHIHFFNKRAETLLGYPGEILGVKNYFEFIHPEDLKRARNLYLQRQNGRTFPQEYTLRLIHRDGTILWVQLNINAMQWGELPATQCIIRDITKLKHLEAQLIQSQKMQAIGNLAGGIAHDINNILGGIQGNVSLMGLHKNEDDPDSQRIRDIETYIRSGSRLTRQLLEFAHPADPEIRPADIDALLDRTANMFCRTRKEIKVYTDFKNSRKIVDLDSGQMEQVILNLLVNAWHAMPDGGTVYIQTEAIDIDEIEADAFQLIPGAYARIRFTDTGTGIHEEALPRIFEPFFSTKPKDVGTGLGLSTAYTIIRHHGGHITVYSRPGLGTTFHIYLPLSEHALPDATVESELPASGTETLLMIDDEPEILKIGTEMLVALGYRVIPSPSGEEAIETFQDRKDEIDMIILDMIMPSMDGETVFDALRKIDPDARVLLSSGYSMSGPAERILKKGCNGFIQKPFNLQTLSRKIRNILDHRESAALDA